MKNNKSFSKILLIQESILIWIITIAFIGLAYLCIVNQYFGELPWLATMVAFPWSAYGVSQACYYKKSEKENTEGGIVYMSALQNTISSTEENNNEVPKG
jgi:EamA domain-containing membrane protein RarD